MSHMLHLVRSGAALNKSSISNLSQTTQATASSGLMVQTYCLAVAQQQDIIIPASIVSKLPPINAQLATARANANDYLTNIQPQIILLVTDVAGYATQYSTFQTLVTGKINDWKGGSTQARQDALDLMTALKSDLDTKLVKVRNVSTVLGTFGTKLNGDVSNFNTNAQVAATVIGGDKGAIAALDSQVSSLDGKIAACGAGIAVGGLMIIGGALLIAAGAIASFLTAGTSIPLVVAGVAIVAVGAAGVVTASIIMANLIKAKADLLTQKAQLNDDLTFLTNFKSQVQTLYDQSTTAATQVTNMKNAWDFLSGDLGNVITSIQNAKDYSTLPVVVQAYIDTAQGQWNRVMTDTQTIQAQMTGVKQPQLPNGALTADALRKLVA